MLPTAQKLVRELGPEGPLLYSWHIWFAGMHGRTIPFVSMSSYKKSMIRPTIYRRVISRLPSPPELFLDEVPPIPSGLAQPNLFIPYPYHLNYCNGPLTRKESLPYSHHLVIYTDTIRHLCLIKSMRSTLLSLWSSKRLRTLPDADKRLRTLFLFP